MKTYLAALAVVVMYAAILGCATQHETYSKGSKNLEESRAAAVREGDIVRYKDETVEVEVSYMSPDKLDVYFSRFKGGGYVNPYLPSSFLVMSIGITNGSTGLLTFDPRMSLLIISESNPLTPLDYSKIYADLNLAEAADLEDRMDSFRETGYDTAVTLAQGESVQRFLVFTRPESGGAGGVLLLNGVYAAHKVHAVSVPYDMSLELP